MRIITYLLLFGLMNCASQNAQENIRKIATWNMKWLGTNSGNQLDALENVGEYSKYIEKTGATLFALQEIGVSHSLNNKPKCFYLDKIVEELNKDGGYWEYKIDDINKQQRLAFLYKTDEWQITVDSTFRPGASFNYIRRPYLANVKAIGSNAELEFVFISLHLKAFPDATEKRRENFNELASWLKDQQIDSDVLLAGDTNLYVGESDVDDGLEEAGYKPIYDAMKTSIHEYELSQRFDRFFASEDMMNEINSAKEIVGNALLVDVIKLNDEEFLKWFDDNLSDHFPVVLNIDVSKER